VSSPNAELLVRITDMVARGEVHVQIAEVLPLAEAARAHELSESGHTRGKIILMPYAAPPVRRAPIREALGL
jgi:NADPH:quinone reductase-like Zn-dependent oxidoreductase